MPAIRHSAPILLVDAATSWRGGQRQVALLARHLRDRGIATTLWSPAGSPLARAARRMGVDVWPAARVPHDASLPAAWNLAAAARATGAVLVHAHDARAHAVARLAVLLGVGIPLVVTRRVTRPPRGAWKYRHGVTRYIAVSHAVHRSLLAAGIPGRSVDIVPSGIPDPPPERPASRAGLGVPRETALIVALSALSREKGVETVVEAARALSARGVRSRWLVAGTGPELDRLRRMARRCLAPVSFLGFVEHPGPLLRAADLLVHAPRVEGLGTAALEALARGLPVVATATGGIPEVVGPKVGTLVPPGRPEAMADAVSAWLTNGPARRTARREGPLVAARFSDRRMAEGTLRTYDRALDPGSVAPVSWR